MATTVSTPTDNALLNDDAAVQTTTGGTASYVSPDLSNLGGRGVKLWLDITVVSGGGETAVLAIDEKDPTSGKYINLLTSAAFATTGTRVFKVYPGLIAAANLTVNDVLPRTWRYKVTFSADPAVTGTWDYTVGYSIIL